MHGLLTFIAWCVALPPTFLLLVLLAELLAGSLAGRRSATKTAAAAQPQRIAILMPAHDEGAGITPFIQALKPQLGEAVRLVVVADNCSDDTAAVARAAGATVIERHNATQRGKGHALAFGRDWLMQDPPDCVVVLDADCELEGDSLALLAERCVTSGRPVQSCYLMRSRPGDAAMVQISNFAFLIKNLVRERGAARIGAPGSLGGTGMAFPWALFRDAPLATSHLVEDLVLGIDFARAGHAPLFLEEARTWSSPATQAATRTQRTRWEHGFLQTATRIALPLLGEGLARGRWSLFWLGLHLAVPPLALLMTLGIAALAVTAVLAFFGGALAPFALLFVTLAIATLALGIAWAREGRGAVSGATLLRIPLYLLWKLPVYLKLVRGTQSEWVRTERNGE
jgi:cellulose synthase/poly-beta-1,6-N-acetylglucosamine synthase-like glycosyltransferase